MTYNVLVRDHCLGCDKLASYIQEKGIKADIINLDYEEIDLPFKVHIVPALVQGDRLIACGGGDIIKYLEK